MISARAGRRALAQVRKMCTLLVGVDQFALRMCVSLVIYDVYAGQGSSFQWALGNCCLHVQYRWDGEGEGA